MDYVHTYSRVATSLELDGSLFSSAILGSWRNGLSGEREPSMVPSRESVIPPLVRVVATCNPVHNRPLQHSTYFRKLIKRRYYSVYTIGSSDALTSKASVNQPTLIQLKKAETCTSQSLAHECLSTMALRGYAR